jgi:trk system potassium uptake protein TrkA
VTVIEDNRNRYTTVEQELEHNIQYGDASELWVLERAGISRADMVIAVTGDDEDNMLICQVAKEKYLVDRMGQQSAEPPALRAARDQAVRVGHRPDPAAARARGPGLRVGAPA